MKTTPPTKKYLGDSIYVDHDTRGLVLTTEGAWGPTNTVVLVPKVFGNLLAYLGIETLTTVRDLESVLIKLDDSRPA